MQSFSILKRILDLTSKRVGADYTEQNDSFKLFQILVIYLFFIALETF